MVTDMGKGRNSSRGVENFSTWGVKIKKFEGGSLQNSTRGVGPFFGRKIFSTRGVKIFQVRESNSKILKGGVNEFQLGESEWVFQKFLLR